MRKLSGTRQRLVHKWAAQADRAPEPSAKEEPPATASLTAVCVADAAGVRRPHKQRAIGKMEENVFLHKQHACEHRKSEGAYENTTGSGKHMRWESNLLGYFVRNSVVFLESIMESKNLKAPRGIISKPQNLFRGKSDR